MGTLFASVIWLVGLIFLAYQRTSLIATTISIGIGLVLTTILGLFSWPILLILWMIFGGLAILLNVPEYRKQYIIDPLFDRMSKNIPPISETERAALEAGTVGWDGELFSGQPQWEKLMTIPVPKLSEEEKAFLEGPVTQLCLLCDDWRITQIDRDLPPEVWAFLKKEGFFGLIIPKRYGGKGFSELAHSEILTIVATRCLTAASTIAVPNSLGPAELLLRYGTTEQQEYYLPRLASGEEIPCFALTGPEAGSDAGAITDTGIICEALFDGKNTLGIRLNWNKRYITLAPLATLLGLAFKLYDPNGLIGTKKDLGITCALIPAQMPGITIGRRHLPCNVPFQNGPTQGEDVFIPLDWIIGGVEMAGQGWQMLVECLSTGRAISLPSMATASARLSAMTSSAYCSIRRQFHHPIAKFEGIQEAIGQMGGFTYIAEAVRYLTVSMIDAGQRPSVPGAISKYHVTELARKVVNHAMDVHGGKAIMMGPKNYLTSPYQSLPIGITVEGANILTRNMIIFGQGAIRSHPYLLKEMQALEADKMADFEHYLSQHVKFTLSNAARALFHGLTLSCFAASPTQNTKAYFQQLSRASSAFALVSDVCLGLFGGKIKFKESLSARLGDLLSMMYLMSALLKRYQDQSSPPADMPLLRWSMDYCLAVYWRTMNELLHNLPQRAIAWGLRIIVMPYGVPRRAPYDKDYHTITEALTHPTETRSRLFERLFISDNAQDNLNILETAFAMTHEYPELLKRISDAVKHQEIAPGSFRHSIECALELKLIHPTEAEQLYKLDDLCQSAIAVDDFDPATLTPWSD